MVRAIIVLVMGQRVEDSRGEPARDRGIGRFHWSIRPSPLGVYRGTVESVPRDESHGQRDPTQAFGIPVEGEALAFALSAVTIPARWY